MSRLFLLPQRYSNFATEIFRALIGLDQTYNDYVWFMMDLHAQGDFVKMFSLVQD